MSATITINKVVNNIELDCRNYLGCDDVICTVDEEGNIIDNDYEYSGTKYYYIPFYSYKVRKMSDMRNKRLGKYFSEIKRRFPDFIKNLKWDNNHSFNYIMTEEKFYWQGWFFTNKFFKSSVTTFYAFDKEEAKKLVKRYVVNDQFDTKYNILKNIENTWDENTIFIISW